MALHAARLKELVIKGLVSAKPSIQAPCSKAKLPVQKIALDYCCPIDEFTNITGVVCLLQLATGPVVASFFLKG